MVSFLGNFVGYFGQLSAIMWVRELRPETRMVEVPMPRTNNHDLPKPDNLGRIRPHVGKLANNRKARFQVGDNKTSKAESIRRLGLLRSLYEAQCERFACDYWRGWTHQVALKIAAGQTVVDTCIAHAENPRHLAGIVAQLQAWGIPVEVTRPDVVAAGAAVHQGEIESLVARLVADQLEKQQAQRGPVAQQALADVDPLAMTETATFHETLDARSLHLSETGNRDTNGNLTTYVNNCRRRLRYLKQHHKDLPLWKLNLPTIQAIVAHWRNRPRTAKSERCSRDHARDMLKELWRYFDWLDTEPRFKWTKPNGLDRIERSPVKLDSDNGTDTFQTMHKETYTPEQLAIILQHTDAFGRAMIGVCVNCAFGQSEIGQWVTEKFKLHQAHPHAARLGFGSTDQDSWLVGHRPKTNVYGEHLLWPQVADAVKPFLDGRPVFPMTSKGKPWYKTHSSNPSSVFTKWWGNLLDRVQKNHDDFPRFPFGSLRDTLPDVLRSRYSADIASLCLQHGTPDTDDELLKCYANQPFGKLFDATRELESYFAPFLNELAVQIAPDSK